MFGDGAGGDDGRRQRRDRRVQGLVLDRPRLRRPLQGCEAKYDRQWEERWIRDVGFGQFIPEAINGLCEKYGVTPADFAKVVYPCYYGGARKTINKTLGFEPEKVQDNMQAIVGDSGDGPSAADARQGPGGRQSPATRSCWSSYGSGCDALFFEVTDNITKLAPRRGITGSLAESGRPGQLQEVPGVAPTWSRRRPGLRGEEQKWTRWSLLWRNHKAILGPGGRASARSAAPSSSRPRGSASTRTAGPSTRWSRSYLSDKGGKIFSFTSDMLCRLHQPARHVRHGRQFNGGGRYVFDFTDCTMDDLAVGKSGRFQLPQ